MGLFGKIIDKNDKIKVQFIDNSNGKTIGVSEMQADQLPETFSVSTTMHIQENDWHVEQAIPENSADFIKSKQLVLKMRKIEYVNPNDIWFSLPTIENTFPNLISQALFTDFAIQIHEDDWLQQEFISASNAEQIENMLDQIKESAEDRQENDGITTYKKCFPRQFPTSKIKDTILLTDIQKALESDKLGSLRINDYEGFAENVFVIEALGTFFYGQLHKDNQLQTFAIYNIGDVTDSKQLENFTKKFKLHFVDWTGMYQLK
jgi:hypothetical protein